MQRGFTKLFNTIVTSTIWQEDDKTRIVWITMLAIADRFGVVSASIPGLASVSNVSVDAAEKAIKNLLAPDPYSRTKDNEGRRIEIIDGGWLILNYEKYRLMLNNEERKEYKAKWIREKRRQKSTNVDASRPSRHMPSASASSSYKSKSTCTTEEAQEFCKSIGLPSSDGAAMVLHWTEKRWPKDWKLTIRKWKSFGYLPSQRRIRPNFGNQKQPAPVYPKLPAKREPTEEELKAQRQIVREASEKLKNELHPNR